MKQPVMNSRTIIDSTQIILLLDFSKCLFKQLKQVRDLWAIFS
jgi:hypothetical protein